MSPSERPQLLLPIPKRQAVADGPVDIPKKMQFEPKPRTVARNVEQHSHNIRNNESSQASPLSDSDCCSDGGGSFGDLSDISTTCMPLHLEAIEDEIWAVVVEPWLPNNFELVENLQVAERNSGFVDLMRSIDSGGGFVAVKRMPNVWVTSGHGDFVEQYPDETERPWVDIGIVQYLSKKGFPYVCEPLGVFRDAENLFVVSSFASEGDLLSWTQSGPSPGVHREALMRPLAKQIFEAVRWLHELDITHGDLSLENILLTHGAGNTLQVKLIDFAMASVSQSSCCRPRGKAMYQAPEMHTSDEYDPMLADVFAMGVVLFTMACNEFPWMSTRVGSCPCFDYFHAKGISQYLAKKRLGDCRTGSLSEVLSKSFVKLLEGLIALQPEHRPPLSEECCEDGPMSLCDKSVWDLSWLMQ